MVFRVFPKPKKIFIKIMHGAFHLIGFVFVCLGMATAFRSHNQVINSNNDTIPHLFSCHSWLGLAVFILYVLQWIAGFLSFLFPMLPDKLRARFLPHHKFWGLAIFGLVIATVLTGISQKAYFILAK